MTRLELIGASLAIASSLFGGGAWIHSHAESTILEKAATSKQLHLMNAAEIQLLKTNMDLQRILMVPEAQQDAWTKSQTAHLLEQKAYWTQRVRDIELKQSKQ